MFQQSIYHTYKRFKTLKTDRISALPIVILMPHSACNCRCVMCDIWKDNKNTKQLTENDIKHLLVTFKKLETKNVVMSGGEALLNPNFFKFCKILKQHGIKISLLSTGLTLKKKAEEVIENVSEVIVSIDGDEQTHDSIRNVDGAFKKLKEGVRYIKYLKPDFKITARSVIHKWNFRNWSLIIQSAKAIGVNSISFLPADVSSEAFNRSITWNIERQKEVVIGVNELEELDLIIENLFVNHQKDFDDHFIVESKEKILQIAEYYKAVNGIGTYPYKKCNAPWVSTVVEADGNVRPCFFHSSIGNIRKHHLHTILNSKDAIDFRRNLKNIQNEICTKCVCSLNLPAFVNPVYHL